MSVERSPLYADEVHLRSEELQAIGYVATESAYLDHCLRSRLRDTLDFELVADKLFLEGKSISSKVSALVELSKSRLLDPKVTTKLASLCETIKKAIEERNTLIHGIWIKNADNASQALNAKNWDRAVFARDAMHTARTLAMARQELGAFFDLYGDYLSLKPREYASDDDQS